MRAEGTLTNRPPAFEIADPDSDFGVVRWQDGPEGHLEAFRLSTGTSLRRKEPPETCRNVWLGRANVLGFCGDQILSYARADGALKVIDAGPLVVDAAVTRSLVADCRSDARVTLIDAATGKLLASRRLPELTPGGRVRLIANPFIDGICVFGRKVDINRPRGWSYRLGCYASDLSVIWSKSVSFALSPEAANSDILAVTSQAHHVRAASALKIRNTSP
jgi:hypothetical protein